MNYPSQAPSLHRSNVQTTWTNRDEDEQQDRRPVVRSMLRGGRFRCPKCGSRTLFSAYLKVSDCCGACGEELRHQRTDDAPPYFTIFIVGHIVIPLLMTVELVYRPPIWLHLAIWLPLTIALSLALLPVIKGALVGLQWALKMHGFDGKTDRFDPSSIANSGTGE